MRLVLVILLWGSAFAAGAQKQTTPCPDKPRVAASDGRIEFVDCHGVVKSSSPLPFVQPAVPSSEQMASDAETSKALQESVRAHFRFDTDSYKHAADVYRWQHTSSIIIFWVVVVLVLSGLILAILQFSIAMQAQLAHSRLKPDANTTFEASLKGLKVSSSVIGLLILGMSMAFFGLYIKFVYPIQNNGQ
jgi:hypothetical protein